MFATWFISDPSIPLLLFARIPHEIRQTVCREALELNAEQIDEFMASLERSVTRQIELIRIVALRGKQFEWGSIEDAIFFVSEYDEAAPEYKDDPLVKFEVEIRYVNGDQIAGQFVDKDGAIEFLRGLQPVLLPSG